MNKKAPTCVTNWQVIIENKDGIFDGLPHLIYASREKRPQYHHNYKAGAMNVLVSLLTDI